MTVNEKIHKALGKDGDWHGLEPHTIAAEYLTCLKCDETFMEHCEKFPQYDTDLAAAFEVVEYARAKGWDICIETLMDGSWECVLTKLDRRPANGNADSLPAAICQAFLQTQEGE